jgi:hypothetical protein
MGSGVALSIAKKWPIVEKEYRYLCDRTHPLHKNLGECQIIEIHRPLFVCNIFGQDGYGSPKDGKQYTNYEAVEQAFSTLGKITSDVDDLNFYLQTAYIPWMMGCYRGGGDWNRYREIIEKHLTYKIVYCKWKG